MKVNLQQSCWLQFNVHYYDKMKSVFGNRERALEHLSETAIETVPKDIEQYMFVNQFSGSKYATKNEISQESLTVSINYTQ